MYKETQILHPLVSLGMYFLLSGKKSKVFNYK